MPAERRLAAAGFADQAHDLAVADRQIHPFDGVHDLLRARRRRARLAIRAARSSGRDEALRDRLELEQAARRCSARRLRACALSGPLQRMEAADRLADRSERAHLRRSARMRRSRTGSAARNAQPGGRLGSEGGMPGICRSFSPRRVRLGHRVEQPTRVGCRGALEHVRRRRPARRCGRRTSRTRVGEAGDHRQVVRDPDQRGAGLAARASASRRGSAPGW